MNTVVEFDNEAGELNHIFQMRYCTPLYIKRLQKYERSNLEVEKNLPDQLGPGCISLESG